MRSPRPGILIVFSFFLTLSPLSSASPNLLVDPGFERYHLNPDTGAYVPDGDAAWIEYGFGEGSVRLNANTWNAPSEMTAERPLGFSPGTACPPAPTGKGRIIVQQDVVNPSVLLASSRYEAWIWFAGAGADNDTSGDAKEEWGGWEIFFYTDENTANWTDENRLEYHHSTMDFPGEPNTFLKISGMGKIPSGARGLRFRIFAQTWGGGLFTVPTTDFGTRVAVDNAHFATVQEPNLLQNGDFEQDSPQFKFTNWTLPDTWPFPQSTHDPIRLNSVYEDQFGSGVFRPFSGGNYTYGYDTYLQGWLSDAFSFGQMVDIPVPDNADMVFSFYWLQGEKGQNYYTDLRRPLGWIEFSIQYLQDETPLRTDDFRADWPVGTNPDNNERFDQNANHAHHVRWKLDPPSGTTRVGVHIRVVTSALPPARELFAQVVDDFYLRIVEGEVPATPTPTPTPFADRDSDGVPDTVESTGAPQPNQTNGYLPDSDGDGLGDGNEDLNRNGFHDPGTETNGRSRDTDLDQFQDGIESLLLTSDPRSDASPGTPYLDSDADGLPDDLDPADDDRDADNDRLLDSYEAVTLGLGAVTDNAQIPPLGDVDNNHNWDNADSQLTLVFFAGQNQNPSTVPGRMDVDRNGNIDNGDAQQSLNYFGNVQPVLPVN